MSRQIIFTALPNGRDENGRFRLSVHVAPRLTTDGGDGLLQDFPEFLSWPPPGLEFAVEFDGLAPVLAKIVSEPDAALWEALFPPNSLVRSQDFGSDAFEDLSGYPVHTYPVTKIAQFLKGKYTQVALTSPDDGPDLEVLLDELGLRQLQFRSGDPEGPHSGKERWEKAQEFLEERLDREGVVDTRQGLDLPDGLSETAFDFFQLMDFFAPLQGSEDEVDALLAEEIRVPTLDFHEAVHFCGQHPAILRPLGLVFDLVFVDEHGVIVPGQTKVRVIPKAEGLASAQVVTPWMHTDVTNDVFAATPNPTLPGLMSDGFLNLGNDHLFEPILIDAQGGGLKAIDFAGNLANRLVDATEGSPRLMRLPSLRADGLAVALKGNARLLKDALEAGPDKVNAIEHNSLELYADDVMRGFRVDVRDESTGRWRSLMHRQGEYVLAGDFTMQVEDEAFLVEAATRKPDSPDLFQQETLFAWDGWSLAVERPGKTHNTDVSPDAPPLIDEPENVPEGFDAIVHHGIVPGTLPALRFGSTYRFRARIVDLAGNSLPADSDQDAFATPPMLFGRFEPAQTPPVVLRKPRGPGESVEVVALRSNYDVDPSPATAERHITTPKVSQRTLELYGALDVPTPDGNALMIDKAAYEELATRDVANLLNHEDGDVDPSDRSDPDGARYYDVEQLEMTWAPDPAAFGFALRLLDGPHAGFVSVNRFARADPPASWFDAECARLVVVEGDGEPTFREATRALTIPLRKGDLVHARLSAVLPIAELGRYGLWAWIEAANPPPKVLSELESRIRTGQHWMFEPFRELTLVHAVRQPLKPPEFPNGLLPSRKVGDTFVDILENLTFSRRSTSKIDILASWREPVDNGHGTGTPTDVDDDGAVVVDRAIAFVLPTEHGDALDEDDVEILPPPRGRHDFGDTKHRMVTYRGVATSRYVEFFTERHELGYDDSVITVDLDVGTDGLVPGSVKIKYFPPPPADPEEEAPGPQHLVEGEHFTVTEETGAVTLDHDEFAGLDVPPQTGDPVVITYAVPPVTRETPDPPSEEDGETGPVLVDVPSSARPAAPRVRYVLPTFGWELGDIVEGGDVVGKSSTRRGNGVRIYLERPWWSSGEGELLGVVTWPPAEVHNPPDLDSHPTDPPVPEDPRRPFVTEWGEDPVYGSAPLPFRYPRLASFRDSERTETGLHLEELSTLNLSADRTVNVAGFEVAYHEARDMWYCDIEVEAGDAYLPFIRFALARFQPSSIDHVHLSRVVLADFVQLAPDRFLSVVLPHGRERRVTVTLTGPTHITTDALDRDAYPGNARVIVQRKSVSAEGELGWTDHGQPVEMVPSFDEGATGRGLWTTRISVPSGEAGEHRLVVEQFETLWGTLPNGELESADRLVHTDIIEL